MLVPISKAELSDMYRKHKSQVGNHPAFNILFNNEKNEDTLLPQLFAKATCLFSLHTCLKSGGQKRIWI